MLTLCKPGDTDTEGAGIMVVVEDVVVLVVDGLTSVAVMLMLLAGKIAIIAISRIADNSTVCPYPTIDFDKSLHLVTFYSYYCSWLRAWSRLCPLLLR